MPKGKCVCKHNTEGHHCERCSAPYYGDAREGTSACKPCLCPDCGPCLCVGQVACQQGPMGHTGHQCDMCIDSDYGDSLVRLGPPKPCKKCECSGNIDPNAVGNWNKTTGQCLKCIHNTAGWNRERCLPGYYGSTLIVPEGGCKRCTCYLPGTLEPERGLNPCESAESECRCRANVVDKWRKGVWNVDSEQGSSACDCNRIESSNQTCDIRCGQCYCRPKVVGRRDSCAPYHYGFSEEEFKDCPPRYSLVEEDIDSYKDKLTELAQIMEELKNHPETVEDLDFRRKLREATRKIDDLIDDAKRASIADKTLINQLNNLQKSIKEISETSGKVLEQLDDGDCYQRYGSQNISLGENVIQQAQDAVTAARKYLNTQGRDAYNFALGRKDRLGQQSQRLSDLPRKARQFADQQEEVEVNDNVCSRALNTSTEAYRVARETADSQERMSNEVYGLGHKIYDLVDFLHRTRQLAEDAKKEANTACDDALGIYTDANSLNIPTVDGKAIKDESNRIKNETRKIKRQVDDLAKERKHTLSQLDRQAKHAEDLLKEAIRRQQITDDLLSDAASALAKVHDSIAFGEKILGYAKETLETLRGFDQQVKDTAKGAENKTFAEDALRGATQDAADARDIAREAQKLAEQASSDADEIRKDAGETKANAEKLNGQAGQSTGQIAETGDRMKAFEDEVEKDGISSKEVLGNANEAKTSAVATVDKGKSAAAKVDDILDALDDMDSIDSSDLDDLAIIIALAEKNVISSDYGRRAEALRAAQEQQKKRMKDSDNEIEQLKREIGNVTPFRFALPNVYYRRLLFEP